jgi:hypothetical protein
MNSRHVKRIASPPKPSFHCEREIGFPLAPVSLRGTEASRRPAHGLAGSVAHARTPDASVGVRNDPPLLVCLPATS